MPNPKMKVGSIGLAVLCLLALGAVVGFAQRHFAIAAAARPEVKVLLAAAVERDNTLVPVEKANSSKQARSWIGPSTQRTPVTAPLWNTRR